MGARTPQAMAAAFYPALASYDATAALPALRHVPTLIVSGTEDASIPPEDSERLLGELRPAAWLVRVPEGGHMVNLARPADVNAALLELLERAAAPEPAT